MAESIEETKLKERVILLMRLYYLEGLHKIGTALDIPEIKNATFYWNLEDYKAALAVAKLITDSDLLQITEKYPPRYITQGGFQGNFYTVTEKGVVSFTSSWDNVRRNVRKALAQWGDRAYGVLQGLINKNGSCGYYELIDEIGKVLGREFVPSYILPRLEPMKLVFKTGSNRYPSWTVPTEIISVVTEELANYKPGQSIGEGKVRRSKSDKKEDALLLAIERKLQKLAEDLVNRKREINIIFSERFHVKLFNDKEISVFSIMKPCSSEADFTHRLESLCSVLDDIRTDDVKKLLDKPDDIKGANNILEALVKQYNIGANKDSIKSLRMTRILRNKKFPTHHDDGEFITAMRYFGISKFPPDWEVLWEKVLEKCVKDLECIRDLIQE